MNPAQRHGLVQDHRRIVSVIDDGIQHAGQAKYVRGLLERRARRIQIAENPEPSHEKTTSA